MSPPSAPADPAAAAAPAGSGISAGYVRVVVDYLRGLERDPAPVLEALGLAEGQLSDMAVRVPSRRLARALVLAGELTGDPHAALAIAQQVRPAHMGPLGYALTSCVELHEGLALFERLQHQVCTDVRVLHEPQGDVLASRHEVLGDVPPVYEYWCFVVASRMSFARWVAGRPLVPLGIDLPCPAPADTRPLNDFMGVAVRYGAPHCSEQVPAQWLAMPNPNADAALHRLMTALSDQAPAPAVAQDVIAAVREQIRVRLPQGQAPTLDDLAAPLQQALGLSPRQVQRRLAEAGQSYKELLEAVRREQVLHELRRTALPLATVAERAGYLEVSSFHRAVRRWTGLTPLAVRNGDKPAAASSSAVSGNPPAP